MEPGREAGQAHRQPLLAWEAENSGQRKHCCLQTNNLRLGEQLGFVLVSADVGPAALTPRFSSSCLLQPWN